MEKYDKIGIGYNKTRKADPYLTERMFTHLSPGPDKTYLDMGCGTGNYTKALYDKGLNFIGIDPSVEMLAKAKESRPDILWKLGKAEEIPMESECIDGILCTFTIHHWEDLDKACSELNRVLKSAGRVVFLTSTPEQTSRYWLAEYFPNMIRASVEQLPAFDQIALNLTKNGFLIAGTEMYHVKPDLQDQFLYVGKEKPELYFDEDIRNGISSFSSLANKTEIDEGLLQLSEDIRNGSIREVMKKYKHDKGDYLFITAQKS